MSKFTQDFKRGMNKGMRNPEIAPKSSAVGAFLGKILIVVLGSFIGCGLAITIFL